VKCGSSAKRRRSENGLPVLQRERRSDAGDPIRPRLCQEAERDLRELRITLPHLAGLGERIDDFAIAVDRCGERPFGLQIAIEASVPLAVSTSDYVASSNSSSSKVPPSRR
jgi:hypothetical protein